MFVRSHKFYQDQFYGLPAILISGENDVRKKAKKRQDEDINHVL